MKIFLKIVRSVVLSLVFCVGIYFVLKNQSPTNENPTSVVLSTPILRKEPVAVVTETPENSLSPEHIIKTVANENQQTYQLLFPANEFVAGVSSEKLKGISYPQVEPFTVEITLPDKWKLEQPDEGKGCFCGFLFSPLNIMQDDMIVGSIAYHEIPYYEDIKPTDEMYWRATYADIMLGNQGNWNNDYTVISKNDEQENAICTIYYSTGVDDKTRQAVECFSDGVLCYNTTCGVYIALEFTNECSTILTDEELCNISRSIVIYNDVH